MNALARTWPSTLHADDRHKYEAEGRLREILGGNRRLAVEALEPLTSETEATRLARVALNRAGLGRASIRVLLDVPVGDWRAGWCDSDDVVHLAPGTERWLLSHELAHALDIGGGHGRRWARLQLRILEADLGPVIAGLLHRTYVQAGVPC